MGMLNCSCWVGLSDSYQLPILKSFEYKLAHSKHMGSKPAKPHHSHWKVCAVQEEPGQELTSPQLSPSIAGSIALWVWNGPFLRLLQPQSSQMIY